MEKRAIADLFPCKGIDLGELNPIRAEEREVLNDERNGIGPRPQRVLNMLISRVVVVAPLAFTETVVTAKKDPVAQRSHEAVLSGRVRAGNDL